jgi:hypothetical protein
MSHAIVQSCCMAVISITAAAGLVATALDGGRVNDPAFYTLWGVSATYFAGDLVYLVVAEPSHVLVMCHHLVALAALGFMFAFSKFRIFMMLIGLQEISTFFMFLKRVESLQSWKAEIVNAFIVTWVVFRGILSPVLVGWAITYVIEDVATTTLIHLGFHSFFLMCNVYWTAELIKLRMRRRNIAEWA